MMTTKARGLLWRIAALSKIAVICIATAILLSAPRPANAGEIPRFSVEPAWP